MIYLLNHSKKAWDLVERKGRTNVIRKRSIKRVDSNTIISKFIELPIDKQVPVIKSQEIATMTAKGNHLEAIRPITRKGSTFVSYDPINFSPVAIPSKRDDQPFLVVSLPNYKDKTPRFTFGGGELLEYLTLDGEFHAVFRFKPGTSFGVALRRTKVTVNYIFSCDEKGIITVDNNIIEDAEVKKLPNRVSKFRPNVPTELVLVQEDELYKLKAVMEERKSRKKHVIKTYKTSHDLDRSLKDTINRYNAVTLFVDTTFRKENPKDVAKYSIVVDLLQHCNIVQKLHKDGKISRVRIM